MIHRLFAAASLAILLGTTTASAGPPLDLTRDQVKTVDGKMVINELDQCSFIGPEGTSAAIYLKRYVEAPQNGPISRDYLVQIAGVVEANFARSIATASSTKAAAAQGGVTFVECVEVPADTAEPFGSLRVIFDSAGLSVTGEMTGVGPLFDQKYTWAQLKSR